MPTFPNKKILPSAAGIPPHTDVQYQLAFDLGACGWRNVPMYGSFFFPASIGVKEKTTVQTLPDVADSLDGTYFTISSANDATNYYVWFSTGGGAPDPAPGGTGINVVITTGATANAVATALQAAIAAITADFTASVLLDTVTITNTTKGPTTDAADGAAPTGFTISVVDDGSVFAGPIDTAILVPTYTPIAVFNSAGAVGYITFGDATVAAPTGPLDGFPVPAGQVIVISSGGNTYLRGSAATLYAYIQEDKGIGNIS